MAPTAGSTGHGVATDSVAKSCLPVAMRAHATHGGHSKATNGRPLPGTFGQRSETTAHTDRGPHPRRFGSKHIPFHTTGHGMQRQKIQTTALLPCPVVPGRPLKAPNAPQPSAEVHRPVPGISLEPTRRVGAHIGVHPGPLGSRLCFGSLKLYNDKRHGTRKLHVGLRLHRRVAGTAPPPVALDPPQHGANAGFTSRPWHSVSRDLRDRAGRMAALAFVLRPHSEAAPAAL